MVIAVTGGHGFLGGAIAANSADRGHATMKLGRPEQDIPSEDFNVRIAALEPEVLVHCAGTASVAGSVQNPSADRRGSVDVLEAVLKQAAHLKEPPQVALISSAAVYGRHTAIPTTEKARLTPVSPYGEHRVECEALAMDYHSRTGAAVLVLRVFSAYGEGLRRQLLWDIVVQAVQRREVVLGGTGRETRDFIHATDVAAAVLTAIEAEGKGSRVLNVGSGIETTIESIASRLVEEIPGTRLAFSGTVRTGDPERMCADVTRIGELGFRPSIAIADGTRGYAAWARRAASVPR